MQAPQPAETPGLSTVPCVNVSLRLEPVTSETAGLIYASLQGVVANGTLLEELHTAGVNVSRVAVESWTAELVLQPSGI